MEITDIVDDMEDVLKKPTVMQVERNSEPTAVVTKSKGFIDTKNALAVKDFEMNKSAKKPNSGSIATPPKPHINVKDEPTSGIPQASKFEPTTSDRKEPKRAGWGNKSNPVLGEDTNKTNIVSSAVVNK